MEKIVKFKTQYYKVLLPSGKGWYGGHTSFDYSTYLPKKGKPGPWLPVRTPLSMCSIGWHVSIRPESWGADNSHPKHRVFKVEVSGKYLKDDSDKICCEKIRLVEEVVKKNGKWVTKVPPKKIYTQEQADALVKKAKDDLKKKILDIRDKTNKSFNELYNELSKQ